MLCQVSIERRKVLDGVSVHESDAIDGPAGGRIGAFPVIDRTHDVQAFDESACLGSSGAMAFASRASKRERPNTA